MSKVSKKHVELVRQTQTSATDLELRFANEGFRVLFPFPPTIQQLDGYIGALSMVLSIAEGGHMSEPALKSVALMLGIGMDRVIAIVEAEDQKMKREGN